MTRKVSGRTLSTIATDPREDWHAGIREWCAYGRSLVAEPDGEVVSVIIVVPPVHIGEVPPPDGWKLLYGTTRKDYRKVLFEGKRLFDALLDRAVEPFETVYAEVDPNNTSGMAGRLLLRGFTEETRLFKLTRRAAGECDHSA